MRGRRGALVRIGGHDAAPRVAAARSRSVRYYWGEGNRRLVVQAIIGAAGA